MTLPASGLISLGNTTGDTTTISVNRELAKASPYQQTISLNDTAVRSLFGIASGAISMNAGYGKTNTFVFNIGTTGTAVNLRTLALAAGWNGTSNVLAKVAVGVGVSSASVATAALTINGSFPNGVTLENRGTISGCQGVNGTPGTNGAAGAGGAGIFGGPGNAGSAGGAAGNGGNGGNGGTAISVSVPVSINNINVISGGVSGASALAGTRSGGGGGAGGAYYLYFAGDKNNGPSTTSYAGGNGGNGYSVAGGGPFSGQASPGAGTGGSGGTSGVAGNPGSGSTYAGGAGGAAGAAGVNGSPGSQGSYLTGNVNVTWVSTGTRTGGVS